MESTNLKLVIREEESEFKDYKNLEVKLGEGMQGEVIKVKSYKDEFEYAMKVVDAVKMKNEQLYRQIIVEALLLNSLKHDNLIKVIDFFKV